MAQTTTAGQVAEGQQILPLIDHLARIGRRASEASVSAGCLRPRHMIALRLLGEHGPMTQHAVGLSLSLDPSNVVGLLNELEERELITRRRDPADRRRHIVELSPAGRTALAGAESALASVQDDVLSGLDDDERCTLHTLLLRAAAKQIANDTCTEAANEPGPRTEAADKRDSC